jgi:ribonuclease Z
VFLTHFHMDHFCGFDRVLRANLDRDKVLHIVGPEGAIHRVYERVKSYEIQHFPFQKVVFQVSEILDGKRKTALLECSRKFPEPEVKEEPWSGPVVFQNPDLMVEAVPTEHTRWAGLRAGRASGLPSRPVEVGEWVAAAGAVGGGRADPVAGWRG